jgi:hypothetical protein
MLKAHKNQRVRYTAVRGLSAVTCYMACVMPTVALSLLYMRMPITRRLDVMHRLPHRGSYLACQ